MLTEFLQYLIGLQGWVHAALTARLNGFAATRDWAVLAAMLPLGVGFGAIHALTPGHGKTVLASYLIGSHLAALRSVAVAAVLAVTHVGSAVLLALIGAPLISRALGGVGRAPALETISRGLLALIGLWLLLRAVRGKPHTHDERQGAFVGVSAGLIPCPLTLFAMILSLSRGVPEAGFAFALAMLLGVGAVLAIVALLSVVARSAVLMIAARHGASMALIARLLDGVAGAALLTIGVRELFVVLHSL